MRTFAEVYSPTGTKLAYIAAIEVATVRERLDQAGTVNLQCALDERVITHLTNGNVVYVYVQEDEELPSLWAAARIIKVSIGETDSALNISIDCRDLIDELRDVTVGFGREYTQQTKQVIFDALVTLKTGWTSSVASSIASELMTARYDGAKALRAIVRTAEETGVHFRSGDTPRLLEIGPFGDDATSPTGRTVRCIKPPSSITPDLLAQDNVLLIESMQQVLDSDQVCNWAIPTGAGEGAAATTLKYTSYKILNVDNTVYRSGAVAEWPIYRRVNAFGVEEYYIDATDGDARREDTPSFKEIGPIANSDLGKQYASDALAEATFAWLNRMRTALESYKFSVNHCPYRIKVGDKVQVEYTGVVEFVPGSGNPLASRAELRYLDVDEPMWVTGVTRSISESGLSQSLEVSTVDRYIMDDTDIVVELAEKMQVTNLAVKSYTTSYEKTYYDDTGNNGSAYSPARFRFRAADNVSDVVKVFISFRTFPLVDSTASQANFAGSTYQLWWQLTDGYNYPSDVSLWVNNVDVTADYGPSGLQWNDGGVNAALDVQDLDITQLIIDNGIHNETLIEIKCEARTGEVRFNTGYPSLVQTTASNGRVEMTFNITVNVRDIVPGG